MSSHLLAAPDALVLFDPLVPEEGTPEGERFWSELDGDVERTGHPPSVLITDFWHVSSAGEVRRRYTGTTVWSHGPAARLIGERVAFTHTFEVGDPLPGGVQAFAVQRRGEVVFWLPDHRALVAGDVLLGGEGGGVRVCPDSWLPEGVDPGAFRESLRPLLDLPVELVLLAHGEPVLDGARDALARALG